MDKEKPQPAPTDIPPSEDKVVLPQSSGTVTTNPATPIPSNQFKQSYEQKPSKWRYFFIILGILQAVGVVVFFLIMTWAIRQAKAGISGTEFIGLLVYVTLVPAVGLIAFINLISLPIYIHRHKPHGKGLALVILSLSVSVILALYGAYNVYQFRAAVQKFSQQTTKYSKY